MIDHTNVPNPDATRCKVLPTLEDYFATKEKFTKRTNLVEENFTATF